MSNDIFSLQAGGVPGDAVLVGFLGAEGLSRLYRFEIFVSVGSGDDLEQAIGQSATLTIHRGLATPDDKICGLITGVDILYEVDTGAVARLVVEPRLAQLGLSRHSRIFTGKKITDVIEAILADNGLAGAFELRLQGSYQPEEHITQYKESDLAFLSRWMEREGMYYFFEHGDDGEKLVITDDRSAHEALRKKPVRYHPALGNDVSAEEHFRSFRCRKAQRPAKVKVRDYDYVKPSLDVAGEASAYAMGKGEVHEHGERFFSPSDGQRLAALRAEEVFALQTTFHGSGPVHGLRSGYLFEVEEHTIPWMNKKYLCVELKHRGNLSAKASWMRQLTGLEFDEVYEVEVLAIDAEVQFRAPRATPWPRVRGFEAAVVDGAGGGHYAQIDDHGRYRVKLHFDESDLSGGKASVAVRMMQPHGGNPEGIHFPLRKGTEVMIGFWGGDPDRPFLAGSVPNALTPSQVTARNNTKNVIHTGSDNRIELEDLAGLQWIDIKTPPQSTYLHLGQPHEGHTHFITLNTGGDCLFDIGTNQDINVGAELNETVQGAVTETYKATHTTKITGPQTTTVTAGVTEAYQNLHLTIVDAQVTEEYKTGQKSTVSGGLRLEVFGAGQATTVSGGLVWQEWTGPHKKDVQGATNDMHVGTLFVHGTQTVEEKFPTGVTQVWGPNTARFASLNWTMKSTKITCPTFDVVIPFDQWAFLSNNWCVAFKFQLAHTALVANLFKLQRVIVSIAANKQKVDGALLALSANGIDAKIEAVKGETKATKTSKFALQIVI